jgi:hypothetical protein
MGQCRKGYSGGHFCGDNFINFGNLDDRPGMSTISNEANPQSSKFTSQLTETPSQSLAFHFSAPNFSAIIFAVAGIFGRKMGSNTIDIGEGMNVCSDRSTIELF